MFRYFRRVAYLNKAIASLPISVTLNDLLILFFLYSEALSINDILRRSSDLSRSIAPSYLIESTLPNLESLGLITIDRSGKAFVISITVSGVNLLNQLERVLSTIRLDR
jgi:hypothetical protein